MVTRYLDKFGEITSIKVAHERLALMADRLEAKEEECTKLRAEVDGLQAEADRLAGENARLREAAVQDDGRNLSKEQEELLRFLFEVGPRGANLNEMSRQLEVEASLTQYHLDHLKKAGFTKALRVVINQGAYFGLTEDGRAYVVERGLLD